MTLIYICYIILGMTPVTQKCHVEEPHLTSISAEQWCDARSAVVRNRKYGRGVYEERVSICHEYTPGEERGYNQ